MNVMERRAELNLVPNGGWQPVGAVEFSGLNTNWGILPATIFVAEVAETVTVDESGFMSMIGGNEEQSPAYLKGLRQGDRFSKIDGKLSILGEMYYRPYQMPNQEMVLKPRLD